MSKTRTVWATTRDEMLADWANCQRGDLMLEYMSEEVSADWEPLRRAVFVVAAMVHHESWAGMAADVSAAVVDNTVKICLRAQVWAKNQPAISFEWNDIAANVMQHIQGERYADALVAAKPLSGTGHLYRLAREMSILSKQLQLKGQRLQFLNRMANCVRAIFPEP